MANRCERVGVYLGSGLVGATFGALSGYWASRILSHDPSASATFGAVSGASFAMISRGATQLRCKWNLIPYTFSLIASTAIGYAAHEAPKEIVEPEPTFYKLAGLTCAIGLTTFAVLNVAYCAVKQARCCEKSPIEQYRLSDGTGTDEEFS